MTPIDEPERYTKIQLLWYTGSTTEVIAKRPTIQQRLGTPDIVIQAVRELAYGRTDDEIADASNERGLMSATGRPFTASSVAWIRLKFKIPKPESDNRVAFHLGIREDGCYSTRALAQELGVGINTIHIGGSRGLSLPCEKLLTDLGGTQSRLRFYKRCGKRFAVFRSNKSE